MAGRPRKEPGTRVHDTRDRHFLQVERNPEFDHAITAMRLILAAEETHASGKNVNWEEISMSKAIRAAVTRYAKANWEAS